MKVDVPIISVKKFMRSGFDFHFTEDGGYMKCRVNDKIFHFIEADNAFWIKLKIPQPDSAARHAGFTRPGNP